MTQSGIHGWHWGPWVVICILDLASNVTLRHLGTLGKWNLGSLLFYEICGYPNHWNHWNFSQFSGAIVIKAIRVLKQDIKAARWKLITEKKHGQKKCYWIFIAWHFEVLFDWGKYVFQKIVVVLSAVSRWGSPFGYL